MLDGHNLDAWDTLVAAFLSSREAIGRDYANERRILRNLRGFLERSGCADLDGALFDRWRAQFQHLRAIRIWLCLSRQSLPDSISSVSVVMSAP